MARIRTIKPEFPQSESTGRLSRDARLLFIQLWTLCDDSGRTRAASRMLASLLFPYDSDAPTLIDGWVAELEREQCVVRYAIDGSTYLQVCNWLNHQKIDKPSASKIPQFDESSRILANPPERSCEDQGSRIKEGNGGAPKAAPRTPAKKTALAEDFGISERVSAWALSKGHTRLPEHLEAFKSKCRAKGYAYVDWDDALMEAIRGDWAKLGAAPAPARPRKML
jgi:hypothetical protein